MEPYERAYLEAVVENLSASIANCLRDGMTDVETIDDGGELTAPGHFWVCGYMTSRLAALRACAVGNPNLDADDLSDVRAIVSDHQREIVTELYS
jgi:hypothetical protein